MTLRQLKQVEQLVSKSEAAKENLETAGFVEGQRVRIPDEDRYPQGEWTVLEATYTEMFGREVPGVVVRNTESKSTITITLHELCIKNPVYEDFEHETRLKEIGLNLTASKILYFDKVKGDQTEERIMGMVNHKIEVGRPIKSSLRPQTSTVEKISLEGNIYKITTVSGSIYYFDPSKSINDIQD